MDFDKIKDYLDIFEITDFNDINEVYINSKFKTLAKKYHPDFGGNTNKFVLLNEAKEFFLKNVDFIKKLINANNIDGLLTVLQMKEFVLFLKQSYETNEQAKKLTQTMNNLFKIAKVNISVTFYFNSLLLLRKANENIFDLNNVIGEICENAIDILETIDYNKINFKKVLENLEQFKTDITNFSDEDRLFYSIYYFLDLFMALDFEKDDLKLKSKILTTQYLRDLEKYDCYDKLMPSEHKIHYYTQKMIGE